MANNCEYFARITGKKEQVEQFVNAMEYKDMKRGFHFARIFSCMVDDEYYDTDTDKYEMIVGGDCAWSASSCFMDGGYTDSTSQDFLEPKHHVFKDWYPNLGYCFANIKVTAEWLCKELGVTFEVWTKEPGCEFQEHYGVDEDGVRVIDECVHWEEGYDEDENGDWLDKNEEKDVGGFNDWGSWYL